MKCLKDKKGFTLVELLATFAIVAVLALVAIPVYNGVINWSRDETCKAHITKVHVAVENFVDECMGNNYKCKTGKTLHSYTVMGEPLTFKILKDNKYIGNLTDPSTDAILKPDITLSREKDAEGGYTDNYNITVEMDCGKNHYKMGSSGIESEKLPDDSSGNGNEDPSINPGDGEIDPEAAKEACELFGTCSNIDSTDITWRIDFETAKSFTYKNTTWYTSDPESGESMYVVATPLIVKDYKIGYLVESNPPKYNSLSGCSYQYSATSNQYMGSCIIRPDAFDHEGKLPVFNIVQKTDSNEYAPILKEDKDLNSSEMKFDVKAPNINIIKKDTDADNIVHTLTINIDDGDTPTKEDKLEGSGIWKYFIYRVKGSDLEPEIVMTHPQSERVPWETITFKTVVPGAKYRIVVFDNLGFKSTEEITAPSNIGKKAKIGVEFKCGDEIVTDTSWHNCKDKSTYQVYVIDRKEYYVLNGTEPVPNKFNIKVEDQSGTKTGVTVNYISKSLLTDGEYNGKYYRYNYSLNQLLAKDNTDTKKYNIYVKPFNNATELESITTGYNTNSNKVTIDSTSYYKYGTYKIDNTPPNCNFVVRSGAVEGKINNVKTGWYTSAIHLDLSAQSDSGSKYNDKYTISTSNSLKKTDIEEKIYTLPINTDLSETTYYGYVYDGVGNMCKKSLTVKVDVTPPECSIKLTGTEGKIGSTKTGWYTSEEVKYEVESKTDATSGVNKYGLITNSSDTTTKTGTQKTDTTGTTINGNIYDKAGNRGTCSATIKKDSVKPECSIKLTGTEGKIGSTKTGWYTSEEVKYEVESGTEVTSGVNKYGLISNSSDTTTKSGTQKTDTTGTKINGNIYDNAGNRGTCFTTIKKDSVKPECSIKLTGTKGKIGSTETEWYISNVSYEVKSKTDATSGVNKYGLITNSSDTTTKTGTQSTDTTGTTINGNIYDKAGNRGTCSAIIKRDTVAPTCSIELTGTLGNDSWYTSDVSYKVKSGIEATSGVNKYGLIIDSTDTTTKSGTQRTDTTGKTIYGNIYDNAGKRGTCSATIKRDTVAPTCSIKITSGTKGKIGTTETGWYISNVNYSIESTASTYGLVGSSGDTTTKTGKQESFTSGVTINGYAKDAAGNRGTCSKTIKVDKTAPTCTHSGDSTSWINTPRPITFGCRDTGGSGCHTSYSGGTRTFTETTQTATIAAYTIYDNAGNKRDCASRSADVYVDTTRPTCRYKHFTVGFYYHTHVCGTDDHSGIGTVCSCDSNNNCDCQANNYTFVYDSDITNDYYAIDSAGNRIECGSAGLFQSCEY